MLQAAPPSSPSSRAFPFPFGERLVVRARVVEDLEALLELRRDRHVQFLAGRQARHEPFPVERQQVMIGRELAEGALDGPPPPRVLLWGKYCAGGGTTRV